MSRIKLFSALEIICSMFFFFCLNAFFSWQFIFLWFILSWNYYCWLLSRIKIWRFSQLYSLPLSKFLSFPVSYFLSIYLSFFLPPPSPSTHTHTHMCERTHTSTQIVMRRNHINWRMFLRILLDFPKIWC